MVHGSRVTTRVQPASRQSPAAAATARTGTSAGCLARAAPASARAARIAGPKAAAYPVLTACARASWFEPHRDGLHGAGLMGLTSWAERGVQGPVQRVAEA